MEFFAIELSALDQQQNASVNNMPKKVEFPFEKARRITPEEAIIDQDVYAVTTKFFAFGSEV